MASYTVNVKFSIVDKVQKWEVVPDPLEVDPPGGDITWVQGNFNPTTNAWVFKSILFTPASPFSHLHIDPSTITVVDTISESQPGNVTVDYQLEVELDGQVYSHDPQIVNKGGT